MLFTGPPTLTIWSHLVKWSLCFPSPSTTLSRGALFIFTAQVFLGNYFQAIKSFFSDFCLPCKWFYFVFHMLKKNLCFADHLPVHSVCCSGEHKVHPSAENWQALDSEFFGLFQWHKSECTCSSSLPSSHPSRGQALAKEKPTVSRNFFIVQMGNTYTYNSMYIQMVESEKWLKVIKMLYPPDQRRCPLPMTPCRPAVGHVGAFYYTYHTLCSPDWMTLIIVCWQFSLQQLALQQQASPKQEMTWEWSLQYVHLWQTDKTSYIIPELTL